MRKSRLNFLGEGRVCAPPEVARGKGILWPLTGTVECWQRGQTSDSQMFQKASNVQPRPDSPKTARSESVSLCSLPLSLSLA